MGLTKAIVFITSMWPRYERLAKQCLSFSLSFNTTKLPSAFGQHHGCDQPAKFSHKKEDEKGDQLVLVSEDEDLRSCQFVSCSTNEICEEIERKWWD